MKEIDGIKDDIVKASVKVTNKLTEDAENPMVSLLVVLTIAELSSELFPKENKEE